MRDSADLFPLWSFTKSFLSQNLGHIINVETIDHTSSFCRRLNNGDITITVIVSRCCIMKYPKRFYFSAVYPNLHNPISVFGLSAVSIVHVIYFF